LKTNSNEGTSIIKEAITEKPAKGFGNFKVAKLE